MLHLALVGKSHGLESAMRVLADPTPPGRAIELSGGGMVEEQERTQDVGCRVRALRPEDGLHEKAVANPVLGSRREDPFEFALGVRRLGEGLRFHPILISRDKGPSAEEPAEGGDGAGNEPADDSPPGLARRHVASLGSRLALWEAASG